MKIFYQFFKAFSIANANYFENIKTFLLDMAGLGIYLTRYGWFARHSLFFINFKIIAGNRQKPCL